MVGWAAIGAQENPQLKSFALQERVDRQPCARGRATRL